MSQLFECPCCGYLTLEAQHKYDICPVCFWEDANDLDEDGYSSCNATFLDSAKESFKECGACVPEMIAHVRAPLESEKGPNAILR